MVRSRRRPGASREDPPSKRGGATTSRPSRDVNPSGGASSASNAGDPVFRDTLGLPLLSPSVSANVILLRSDVSGGFRHVLHDPGGARADRAKARERR